MKKVGGDFLFNFIPRKRRQTWLEPNDDKILDDQGRVKEFIRLRMCREDCHAMYNEYGRKIDGSDCPSHFDQIRQECHADVQ